MDDFIKQLTGIRTSLANKAGQAGAKVKSKIKSKVSELTDPNRTDPILEHERARNRKMIEENFGSVENYEKFNRENPMPGDITLGQTLMRIYTKLKGKK